MIKTIALAEIYAKKDYYKANPINHNEALPSIITQTSSSWLVDEEIILVRYPNESKKYIVTKYFFGMTQYRLEEKLINEDTFCKSIGEFSKNNYACTN